MAIESAARQGDIVTIVNSIHIERSGEIAECVRVDNGVPILRFRDGEEKPCPNSSLYGIMKRRIK